MLAATHTISAQDTTGQIVSSEAGTESVNTERAKDNYLGIQWNPSNFVPEKGSSSSYTGFSAVFGCTGRISVKNPKNPLCSDFFLKFQYSTRDKDNVDFSMSELKMGVGFGLGFNIPNSHVTIVPLAGFYYGYRLSAKAKSGGTTINYFDEDDMGGSGNTWTEMPIGWYAGLHTNINNCVVLRATYGKDFNNLGENVKTKIQTTSITLGFCF